MKEQQLSAGSGVDRNSGIFLQQLVDGLVGNSLPLAWDKESEVVNDVGRGVFLRKVNYRLLGLMDEVLRAVIINSNKGDIHISAEKRDGNLAFIIQERSNYNGYALAYSIGAIEPEATAFGGHLSISGQQKKVATIVLSFPDNLSAA